MAEPREIPSTDWTPNGDRMLALLPVEHPASFDALPFEDQQWRGRLFLMVYTHTGSVAFSWWEAMKPEYGADEKAFALSVDEDEIAFRVAEAAQGRWYGEPEEAVKA